MSLYKQYRPKELDQMIGNEGVVEALGEILEGYENRPHAMLFSGPTGCGKTTLARIVADKLGALRSDLVEVDSADFRGIDTVRNIIKQTKLTAMYGDVRVWIIDECHKMTNDAQNALLKVLEDTPKHVYFILCTTDPQKLIKTVKGRCMTFEVKRLNDEETMKLLKRICKGEGVDIDKGVLRRIVIESQGFARNAIQILENVMLVSPEKQLETAKRGAEQEGAAIELCRVLVQPNVGWKSVQKILNTLRQENEETIRRQVLGYCAAILLKKDDPQIGLVMEMFIEPFYNSGWPGLVFACYSVVHAD